MRRQTLGRGRGVDVARLTVGGAALLLALAAGGCSDDGGQTVNDGATPETGVADGGVDASPKVRARLIILHTNDLHSHLLGHAPNVDYSPGTTGDDTTVGGFARLAAEIARQRAAAGDTPVLLLDAGDFLMGTLFSWLGPTRSVELTEMAKMGYDAVTIGNHEFDWTPEGLAGFVQIASDAGFSAPLMATNIKFEGEDTRDNGLEDLMTAGVLQRTHVMQLANGVKVGLIGLMGDDAASVAPFLEPVTFEPIVDAAKPAIAQLRQTDKVDLVVALSHSGVNASGVGEDKDLAAGAPGIDVIVSGHTHVALEQPVIEGGTAIVQAGAYGKYLGRLELELLEDGSSRVGSYELIKIDDEIAGDAPTQTRIDGYIGEIDGLLSSASVTFKSAVAETSFDLPRQPFEEMGIGDLIADAYLSVVSTLQPGDPPDIAIESPGGIRASIAQGKTGKIWFSDLYRVLSTGIGPDGEPGFPLVTFYVNGADVRIGMEAVALARDLGNSHVFLQLAGLQVEYDPAKLLFQRVTSVKKSDGTAIDLADTSTCYKVVTTLNVAELFGLLASVGAPEIVFKEKDCSTPVADITNRIVDGDTTTAGLQELKHYDALLRFVGSFADTNGNQIPDLPAGYKASAGRIKTVAP